MISEKHTSWQPLGTGRMAPAGSIVDRDLGARLATYKSQVAGRYRSVAPRDLASVVTTGRCVVSPKIDGETWFLQTQDGDARLVSPTGKIIADVPVTQDAREGLSGQDVLLAGELYANGRDTRPRVHDLHAALGGGPEADVEHLHFAAFDLIEKAGQDVQALPFADRADRLTALLGNDGLCHSVPFEWADGAQDLLEAYERLVTRGGHEGIVIRFDDGRMVKVKPQITIDAVVVGFTERASGGAAELLLALMRPDSTYQLLGRVDTGFTEADRQDLSVMLGPLAARTSYLAASRSGAVFRFVRPEAIVEVRCNDLLAVRANGEPVRRMALECTPDDDGGWRALGPMPAVSLINAVFVRVRDDKVMSAEAVRFSQVTDLVSVEDGGLLRNVDLPRSTHLRREVLTKTLAGELLVRKAVVWRTNKQAVDPLYPAYVAFFADFAPERAEPLKTDVRVASSAEGINALADRWLAAHAVRGWAPSTDAAAAPSLPASCRTGRDFRLDLQISFARTPSVNFHVAVRRMKALASAGTLTVEDDDKGRPRHYTLTLRQDALVESIRRIENLYRVILRWTGAEVLVNGDPLGLHETQGVFNAIRDVADCWRRQRTGANGDDDPCRAACTLACRRLRFTPSPGFPGIPREHPAWYAVGRFDGKAVTLDKDSLLAQLDAPANEMLALCPFFDRARVRQRIANLPEKLDPGADTARWALGYSIQDGKPVWVFPANARRLPFDVTLSPDAGRARKVLGSALHAAGMGAQAAPATSPSRSVPGARYADVCGQDAAVEAVRDYADLPLKHAELFQHVGVRPGRGILLWGPPGNGKTLLARAVAGESGAHIETLSGPEVLSKWVGEGERRLRDIFDRAARLAPAVVLIDEIDAVAGSRDACESQHQRELVSQLLVLLDGLVDRGRVLVIATTNRPGAIDPAIRRPGRIDRQVYMGPPNRAGRTALFAKLLARMPTAEDVDADHLAGLTEGFSGARIEHAVNEAGLSAIKDALAGHVPQEQVRVGRCHFREAMASPRGDIAAKTPLCRGANGRARAAR